MFRKLKQWYDGLQADEVIAIACFALLIAAVAFLLATDPGSSEESFEAEEVSAVKESPEVADWPGSATLAEEEAAIAYAAALDSHHRAEWAGAAEAARVIEAQRAEQARQAAATPPQTTEAPRPVAQTAPPANSSPGGGCVIPDYICARESNHSYTALNPSSGAGGMYQFLPSTWNNTAQHAGRPDLVGVPPHQASPADQDAMAAHLWEWQGSSPWALTR